MGRAPCCSKVGLHRGPWTPREDTLLTKYIQTHGDGNWRSLPKKAGLLRCGKSCRLRWMNYLRPDIKRGNITPDEDDLIIRMHSLLGNRWSLIAGRLPGRTDNEIKNYWNTHLSKLLRSQGTDPNTHKKLSEPQQQVKTTKRDKNNNNNTKNKQKRSSKLSPPKVVDKPKVHQPKPVRFTSLPLSRNNSFDCNSGSSSSSRIGEVGGLIGSNDGVVLLDVPNWCAANVIDDDDHHHHNGVSFLIGDEDDHDCHANHDHHDIVLPNTSSSNLERLYEEYLSLLETDEDQSELDTFAESLLL